MDGLILNSFIKTHEMGYPLKIFRACTVALGLGLCAASGFGADCAAINTARQSAYDQANDRSLAGYQGTVNRMQTARDCLTNLGLSTADAIPNDLNIGGIDLRPMLNNFLQQACNVFGTSGARPGGLPPPLAGIGSAATGRNPSSTGGSVPGGGATGSVGGINPDGSLTQPGSGNGSNVFNDIFCRITGRC